MKVAIIGAGFTGLSAAYNLLKKGHDVSIFEQSNFVGGLAGGIKPARNASRSDTGGETWEWTLEHHYHHIFTSDNSIIKIAKEVNVPILFFRPKTKSLIDKKIYPLDSPLDVLKFQKLTVLERLRLGLVLAYLKFSPFQKWMEKVSATEWLRKKLGKKSFEILWEPLLEAKFGEYKNEIPLSWFWARIKKRSARLGYPEGGFQNLSNKLKEKIEKKGGKFYLKTKIEEIKNENNNVRISFDMKTDSFDKVIVTTPSSVFLKIAELPRKYIEKLEKLKGLSALTLILVLNKPFLTDKTYWVNVCEKDFPFLSIVEHTNFIDKKYYNNSHIVYVGKYLPLDHPYMKMTKEEILKIYDPYLKKINPTYHLSLITYHLFKASFAQPVITLNYSKIMPSFETPLKNVFLANMQQVYPWDRGTNYAVELGEKVAERTLNSDEYKES